MLILASPTIVLRSCYSTACNKYIRLAVLCPVSWQQSGPQRVLPTPSLSCTWTANVITELHLQNTLAAAASCRSGQDAARVAASTRAGQGRARAAAPFRAREGAARAAHRAVHAQSSTPYTSQREPIHFNPAASQPPTPLSLSLTLSRNPQGYARGIFPIFPRSLFPSL
jgi:hypothetical protein